MTHEEMETMATSTKAVSAIWVTPPQGMHMARFRDTCGVCDMSICVRVRARVWLLAYGVSVCLCVYTRAASSVWCVCVCLCVRPLACNIYVCVLDRYLAFPACLCSPYP